MCGDIWPLSIFLFMSSYYLQNRWLSLRVVPISTPLLIGSSNMHHHTPLMLYYVWVVKMMVSLFVYHTHFILLLRVYTNYRHFIQLLLTSPVDSIANNMVYSIIERPAGSR